MGIFKDMIDNIKENIATKMYYKKLEKKISTEAYYKERLVQAEIEGREKARKKGSILKTIGENLKRNQQQGNNEPEYNILTGEPNKRDKK